MTHSSASTQVDEDVREKARPPMSKIKDLEAECERLRKEMHEAPMNKVFQDHTGHRFLGTHSMAWADRSREWVEACKKLAAAVKAGEG
jgi:hypothetical protein